MDALLTIHLWIFVGLQELCITYDASKEQERVSIRSSTVVIPGQSTSHSIRLALGREGKFHKVRNKVRVIPIE